MSRSTYHMEKQYRVQEKKKQERKKKKGGCT